MNDYAPLLEKVFSLDVAERGVRAANHAVALAGERLRARISPNLDFGYLRVGANAPEGAKVACAD